MLDIEYVKEVEGIMVVTVSFQCSKEELMEVLGLPVEETEERAVVAMVVQDYFELHKEGDNENRR